MLSTTLIVVSTLNKLPLKLRFGGVSSGLYSQAGKRTKTKTLRTAQTKPNDKTSYLAKGVGHLHNLAINELLCMLALHVAWMPGAATCGATPVIGGKASDTLRHSACLFNPVDMHYCG